MTTEQIITHILSKHPEISREEVEERLERQKRKTNGFISDETLLRMIAAELGTKIQDIQITIPTLSLADLVPSLNNVTVAGRVVAVFSPKTFNGNRSGKLASLIIVDTHSILRVVLWNDRTRLIESKAIKVGQIVRVSHGYTKEGRGGVELHIGERSQVEVNPEDLNAEDYPAVDRFTTKIGELISGHWNKRVNVAGTVRKLFSATNFERQDSSPGKVMRLIIADETGEISIVVWNERVDELERVLKEDVGLRIINARVKRAVGEGLEVHVDSGTYVEAFFQSKGS
jgi:ssDNA-binding replication factor A large subunit